MRKLGIILGILWMVFGCQDDANTGGKPVNFSIEGSVTGGSGLKLYLETPSENGMITVMSGDIDAQGNFRFQGNVAGLGFYQLRLGEDKQQAIPVTPSPQESIYMHTTKASFTSSPGLSGESWCNKINQYLLKIKEFQEKQQSLFAQQGTITEAEFNAKLLSNKKPVTDFVVESVNQDPDNPANLVLVMELFPMTGFEGWNPAFLEVFKEVVSAYKTAYGDVPAFKALSAQYEQLELGYQQFDQLNRGEIVAPNFALTNTEGKTVQLTDFRGDLVLIDFWASWCGPCRQESPNMVRIYQRFKGKNFTILSVSLDEDPVKWKEAISKDGLVWKNHVSDLRGWQSGMPKLYAFDGIPFTVLVNPEGKIIARGLRGTALESKIESYYSQVP